MLLDSQGNQRGRSWNRWKRNPSLLFEAVIDVIATVGPVILNFQAPYETINALN